MSETRRLRQFEEENSKLKRLVAALSLGNGTINGADATAIANQLNDTCATPTPTITPTP